MMLALVSLFSFLWMGCHTAQIPNPAVPPVAVNPTAVPGPFDYTHGPAEQPAAKYPRRRLAVARFNDNIPVKDSPFGEKRQVDIVTSKTHVHQEEILAEKNYAPEQFTEKMIDALAKTQRFILIERKDINPVLRELTFNDSKWSDKLKSAQTGKVSGPELVVTGALSLNDDPATRSSQPYALYLRTYEVETSQIVAATKGTGKNVSEVIDRAVMGLVTELDRSVTAPAK